MNNTRTTLEAMGLPDPGNHPITGEEFVNCQIERTREQTSVDFLKPTRPGRIETTWDDDDNAIERERTDEELKIAIAEYEIALAAWEASRGKAFVVGPSVTRARFTTKGGSSATAFLRQDNTWLWSNVVTVYG